jgi:hypothetical protein
MGLEPTTFCMAIVCEFRINACVCSFLPESDYRGLPAIQPLLVPQWSPAHQDATTFTSPVRGIVCQRARTPITALMVDSMITRYINCR